MAEDWEELISRVGQLLSNLDPKTAGIRRVIRQRQ